MPDIDQRTAPYRFGYDYGMGVRLVSGDPKGLAVQGAVTPVQGAPGLTGELILQKIESTSDLEDALDISADASGGVGLFSASARFDYSRKVKIHTNSLCLLIKCGATGFQQIDDPSLKPNAGDLVASGKAAQFDTQFGDGFVRGIITGGAFFGLMKITFASSDSRTQIDASMSGSYGLAFSADVSMNLSKVCSQTNSDIEIFVYYEGGVLAEVPVKLTPDELLKIANLWLQSLPNNKVSYAVTISPYAIANGPTPPNAMDLANQQMVIAHLARMRSLTTDRRNLVEFAMDPANKVKFNPFPADLDLAQLQAGLDNDITYIGKAASFALDNPQRPLELEPYVAQIENIPNYKVTAIPANFPDLKDGPRVFTPDFIGLTGGGVFPYPVLPKVAALNIPASPLGPEFVRLIINDGLINSAMEKKILAEANAKGVTLHWQQDNTVAPPIRVVRQDPPAGTPIARGATVTIVLSALMAQGKPGSPLNELSQDDVLKSVQEIDTKWGSLA